MMNKSKFFIILFIVLNGYFLQAQNLPKIQAKVDTTKIRIGEQIKLQIKVKTDTLSFVDFPDIKELGDFEVVNSSEVDTLKTKPVRELLKNYFLTQWDSGKYVIPPINLGINNSIIRTDSIPKIEVLGVKVDTVAQPAYGFKNIINTKGVDASNFKNNKRNYIWVIIIILIISILGYYFYYKRKKSLAAQKNLSAFERAMKKWKKLQQDKLWLQNKTDLHYLILSSLLKDYIEQELKISAKEKVSSELLQDLKKYRFEDGTYFNPELLNRMEIMLKRADLAKYAKSRPDASEIDLDMNLIKDFIDTSHQIISKIEEEKELIEAQKRAEKKRKKQILYYSLGTILGLILLVGGVSYYYLNKHGILEQVVDNVSSPEWLYNEYGANPALGVTTPHILKPADFLSELPSKQQEQLKKIMDEISVYTDENIIKGYAILELNLNLKSLTNKQNTSIDTKKINDMVLQQILQYLKAEDVEISKDQTEDGERFFGKISVEVPKINVKRKLNFDSYFYNGNDYLRMLSVFYIQGNKENKEMAEKVLNSAQLIKE